MFIAEETIGVNDKKEAENSIKIDERKSCHPTRNRKFPSKICHHSYHSYVADAKKKEIDSFKDLP